MGGEQAENAPEPEFQNYFLCSDFQDMQYNWECQ